MDCLTPEEGTDMLYRKLLASQNSEGLINSWRMLEIERTINILGYHHHHHHRHHSKLYSLRR